MARATPSARRDLAQIAADRLSIDKQLEATQRADPQEVKEKRDTSSWDVEEAPRKPLQVHSLQLDQLHQLATMPRRKRNEGLLAAFWAAVTSATPAFAGYFDVMSKAPKSTQLDLVEIVTFAVCVAAVVLTASRTTKMETAEEYMRRICGIEGAPVPGIRGWFIRKVTEWLTP
jgi:hypothetical protein